MSRTAEISRKTTETQISLTLDIDGSGCYDIYTGIGFFDHMLNLLAKHSGMDIKLSCKGDINVDGHHTVEDVGIVLGQAISRALGDKASVRRYGSAFVPMDEVLAMAALDLSGRPYFVYNAQLSGKAGEMDAELVEEFFRAVAVNAGITLHMEIKHGSNNHHMAEALYKAFARALSDAVSIDPRVKGIPSTKGVL